MGHGDQPRTPVRVILGALLLSGTAEAQSPVPPESDKRQEDPGGAAAASEGTASYEVEPNEAPEETDSSLDFVYAGEELSLVRLLELEVISASAKEESLAKAPAVLHVVTSDEIERYGYQHLGEALQAVPGLDLLHDHYQYNLGVRGITSGQRGWSRSVKVMIDGQPTSFRPSGENFLGLEAIPLSLVDRIEVIRGPMSVLYGENAFLGVINIITKEGYQLDGGILRAGYEGSSRLRAPWGEIVGGSTWGRWSLVAGAAGESRKIFGYEAVPLPGRAPISNERSRADYHPNGSTFARLTFRPADDSSLELDGHFQLLDRDADFMDWGPLVHDNQQILQNAFVRLRYQTRWLNRWEFRASGALSFGGVGDHDRLNVGQDLDTHIERDVGYQGRDLEASLVYELPGRSHVGAGVDSSFDTQTLLAHYTVTPDGTRVLNPPANAKTGLRDFINLGVYANTTIYPFELAHVRELSSIGLTGGLRMDTHNIYGRNYNGRAGVSFDLVDIHYIKILYGSSYRAPSSTQLFSNYIEPGGIIGNPNLRAERAQTIELAVGSSPARGLTLRGNAFYTNITDRVEIRQPSVSSPVDNRQPVNSTPIDSFGGELELDYRFFDYSVFLNYSGQTSSFTARNNSIDGEIVNVQTSAYPNHLVKFGGSADIRRAFLRLSLVGRIVGERLGTLQNNAVVNSQERYVTRYALPSYAILDLTVSSLGLYFWGRRETRLSMAVRNLFDAGYVFPSYGLFDIPGFRRSYELSLRQEL